MNKFSLYVLLILLFLGLSKSFSPLSQKTRYIPGTETLSSLKSGAPLTIILVDSFEAGFLIKTYYFKLKVIHAFKSSEELTVRVSPTFWNKSKDYVGMSLFRRSERENEESTLALPAGSLFLGDRAFGKWIYKDSGEKVWRFHKVYRHFPKAFFWNDFTPNIDFYDKLKVHQDNDTPYFGLNNEFGTSGTLTRKLVNHDDKGKELVSFKEHFYKYLAIPPWKNKR